VVGTRLHLSVESSSNLQEWHPGQDLRLTEDPNAPWQLNLGDESVRFYRLHTELVSTDVSNDGAELLGYHRVFARELRKVGYLSVDDFQARFDPVNPYLEPVPKATVFERRLYYMCNNLRRQVSLG